MKTIAITTVLAVFAVPAAAWAEGGEGSRQAAGGGFMSSYVTGPYHDPRSQFSQRAGTGEIQREILGEILGQPMVAERGRWAVGR
ncbi:hypothetical protein [Methylobacterium sp. SyP6R]|uniref:hypothetical protein n=1 Tax=Methylobacterium sp. SyP6R TaxID=2718876 RepID=UPI001F1AB6C5|nr:hypothetical protein [Methylobacterium sp. SyP6R]MCF4129226.1 hypothetical protein [Methylobacterium sp. SyP6R]